VNTGPGVECFDCGSFFMEGGNRSLFANLDENKNDLLVISTSFNRSTWACSSCETSHDILPLRYERNDWEGGENSLYSRTRTCRRCCRPRRGCAQRLSGSTEASSGS
jgi:hypothetical protein